MKIERTKNAVKGTAYGVLLKVITLIFPFIIRTIFIKRLGAEYLGLNSMFSSILQVLNLAELGVGSALVFSMYKPIIDDEHEKICALMNLYRTYYRIIGIVVLILGLMVIPFIPNIISGESPADVNVYIIYILQLMTTVLSYWMFAYRNSLFQAFQRTDIVSIIAIIINLCLYALQIITLIVWHNYYLYLSISIIFQIFSNIITAVVSRIIYPDYKPRGKLERNEIKSINIRVKSLFTAKIGSVVAQSFDTLVISAYMGLTTVAVYQNYFYILNSVYAMIMVFFASAQAGIGNYLLTHSEEDKRKLFNLFVYITALIGVICSNCFLNLYQPFMKLWVGEEFLLDSLHVVLLVIYFFVYLMLRPFCVFKDSAGMWRQDRFRPLASAIVNLVLNIATVKTLGLYGVIGSTIVAVGMVSIPWVIININKNMFRLKIRKLILRELSYVCTAIVACAVTFMILNFVDIQNPYISIIVRLIISVLVSITMFEVIYYRTYENAYFINNWKQIVKGKM